MDYRIWSQILLELAMAVSSEEKLDDLLKKAVPVFLRKLDCTSVVILQNQGTERTPVFAAPKWTADDEAYWRIASFIGSQLDIMGTRQVMHLKKQQDYYGFKLQDFGLMIITRAVAFEYGPLMELLPVINMLAHNCRSCMEFQRREAVEETLRNERTFLSALVNTIPDLIFYKEKSGKYQLVNEAVASLLGKSADDMVGLTDEDLHPPEVARLYRARDEKLLKKQKSFTYETQYTQQNGRKVAYETTMAPFYGDSQEVQGIIGIARNIEERKQIEATLERRMAFQSMLMNLATSFINVSIDQMDWSVQQVLASAGGFMKVDRAYVFAYDFKAGLMHNTHEWCASDIEPAIHTLQNIPCQPYQDSWVQQHQRGEMLVISRVENLPRKERLYQILSAQGIQSLITIPLMDGSECRGFIGFDAVREPKKWQDDEISLLKVVAELFTNAEIKKRHEKEMMEARQAAETASQAKSEFLANMSHEIRTPLHGVVSAMYLMQETLLSQEQQQYLTMINDSVDSLLSVINSILDYSKIEAGHVELTETAFDLREEVGRVVSILKGKAAEKALEIKVNYHSEAPSAFWGDQGKIRQILLNLVLNAIKFTDQGHVQIEVHQMAEKSMTDHAWMEVRVTDTGKGIPESFRPYIFQQFTQEDHSTTKKYGGTGLGLAIAKSLVEFMGGSIHLESRMGVGSTFSFHLSMRRATEAEVLEVTPEQPKPPSSRRPLPTTGIRVLLVDDHRSNRMAARMILAKRGYEVVEAASGFQAIELLKNQAVDMILMDIQMPEMDGYETARRIREMGEAHRQIPIFALTANAMVQDRQRSLEAGMDGHIAKPFKLKELDQIFETLWASVDQENRQEAPQAAYGGDHQAKRQKGDRERRRAEVPSEKVFHLESVMNRYDGDTQVIQEVVKAFLEELPEQLRQLQEAVDQKMASQLTEVAHSLKGASSYVSAEEINALSRNLMTSAGNQDWHQCREQVKELEAAADRLEAALAREMPWTASGEGSL